MRAMVLRRQGEPLRMEELELPPPGPGQVAHRGANLDVHVALFNAAGKKVAENDPRNDTSSNLKTRVSPGRYKLEIQGVGNAAGPYSSYGSIGQYYISGSVPPTKTTLAKSNR